jgi:DNA-binding Xre family transcriptional regulator
MHETPLSTFDRMMENPAFQQRFEEGYKEFLLSELVHAMMDHDEISVRKLAQEIGVSPTAIQNVRSGRQKDMKITNFLNLAKACGYRLVLEKNDQRIIIAG